MAAPIDFYFEFASPYGYLASTQIDAIGARHGREVAWHPIMLGAAFKETGAKPLTQTPLKGPYLLHDVPRFARLLGVPFTATAGHAGQLARREPRLHLACRRTIRRSPGAWPRRSSTPIGARARTSARPSRWPRSPQPLGIGRAALLAAVADPAIKERLKRATAAAIERGVFGSPFVFVDGEPFWGADRLPQVDAWLARGGW